MAVHAGGGVVVHLVGHGVSGEGDDRRARATALDLA
jgi:hypothetical protein